jgi:uncharacterized membrane protein|tara:strand:+ start:251 stop:610 length:360 start_codon:yes stop_codon:yes gene_type:complete
LKKEVFSLLKKELAYILALFVIFLIIFKIIYFKEGFLIVLRTVLSLFWLFALPGYFAMFYWREKIGFTERFVVGIAFSAAIIGILSYYLGLIGLNIKFHVILLPLAIIITGFFFLFKEK